MNKFSEKLPKPNKKIIVDFGDSILKKDEFLSETKMLPNQNDEIILCANLIQDNGSDFWCGIETWFKDASWRYSEQQKIKDFLK